MADMKMRKHEAGGYLVGLSDGQLKKWENLKREMIVEGAIVNKRWETPEPYELSIDGHKYRVTVEANKEQARYAVTITNAKTKASISRVYKTWECNDCIIRTLLELHNATLASQKANGTSKQA